MTIATPKITVLFGGANVPTGNEFVIGSATHGLIESAASLIAGDTGVQVEGDAFELHVVRGRNRELDEFDAGTCDVKLWNTTRTYDNENAASALFGLVTPGKRFSVQIWDQTVFTGQVEDWANEWTVDGVDTTTMFGVDALGELAQREFAAWTTTAGQLAGARLDAALDRSEIGFGVSRDFDTGVSTLQGDNVTDSSNALNYLQLVVKSDAGRLFATRENVLRFQDRLSLVNPTSDVAFSDDGSATPFHGINTASDSALLFNRVGVDRETGILQTVEDTASQQAVGIRSLSVSGLLMDSDSQSESMASWLLGQYKDPVTRISSIAIKVSALTSMQRGAVTRLDLGDVITVGWTPSGNGAELEQLLVIEGIEDVVNQSGSHVRVFNTSIAQQVAAFIIEDPVFGLIETGGVIAF